MTADEQGFVCFSSLHPSFYQHYTKCLWACEAAHDAHHLLLAFVGTAASASIMSVSCFHFVGPGPAATQYDNIPKPRHIPLKPSEPKRGVNFRNINFKNPAPQACEPAEEQLPLAYLGFCQGPGKGRMMICLALHRKYVDSAFWRSSAGLYMS